MIHQLPNNLYADRMQHIPISFIREILKVASQPGLISFAGGLPNPNFFPADQLNEAAQIVLGNADRSALQYTITEGYLPLREYIANQYLINNNLEIDPDEILITNGSQQGLDIIAKLLINTDDCILMEDPTYLGAIQSFSAYQPKFITAELDHNGINLEIFRERINNNRVKIFYTVPNFQNPSGTTYCLEKRIAVAESAIANNFIIVEDDPYGEIRFEGLRQPLIKQFAPQHTVLLGSFSKTISPGVRLGWMVANKEMIKKASLVKQASDLHSNHLAQRIICQYLKSNDLNTHIQKICIAYKDQRDLMMEMVNNYFPKGTTYKVPEGGMFLWVTLPTRYKVSSFVDEALLNQIAYVPGSCFYIKPLRDNTLRLNFSNTKKEDIKVGIKRLGRIFDC